MAEVARIAALVNARTQNIGARRLHTILERLLDAVSFEASDPGRSRDEVIDAAVVRTRLREVVEDEDLSRYISLNRAMPIPQTAVPGVERPQPSRNRAVMDRARAHLLQNYKQQPIVLERGQGTKVWDADGNVYLDLLGGIATLPFGHCHPDDHRRGQGPDGPAVAHLQRLLHRAPGHPGRAAAPSLSGLDRAFFCNSGAEANEALLKLARQGPARTRTAGTASSSSASSTSFHGRTLATLTATGQPKYQKGFEPLLPGVGARALRRPRGGEERDGAPDARPSSSSRCRARVGCAPRPRASSRRCARSPTSTASCSSSTRCRPGIGPHRQDVRLPARGHPARRVQPRQGARQRPAHRSDGVHRGGREGALARARTAVPSAATRWRRRRPSPPSAWPATRASSPRNLEKGEHVIARGRQMQAHHPSLVKDVRGRGLLLGIELSFDAGPVVTRCRERGMLCNLAGEQHRAPRTAVRGHPRGAGRGPAHSRGVRGRAGPTPVAGLTTRESAR